LILHFFQYYMQFNSLHTPAFRPPGVPNFTNNYSANVPRAAALSLLTIPAGSTLQGVMPSQTTASQPVQGNNIRNFIPTTIKAAGTNIPASTQITPVTTTPSTISPAPNTQTNQFAPIPRLSQVNLQPFEVRGGISLNEPPNAQKFFKTPEVNVMKQFAAPGGGFLFFATPDTKNVDPFKNIPSNEADKDGDVVMKDPAVAFGTIQQCTPPTIRTTAPADRRAGWTRSNTLPSSNEPSNPLTINPSTHAQDVSMNTPANTHALTASLQTTNPSSPQRAFRKSNTFTPDIADAAAGTNTITPTPLPASLMQKVDAMKPQCNFQVTQPIIKLNRPAPNIPIFQPVLTKTCTQPVTKTVMQPPTITKSVSTGLNATNPVVFQKPVNTDHPLLHCPTPSQTPPRSPPLTPNSQAKFRGVDQPLSPSAPSDKIPMTQADAMKVLSGPMSPADSPNMSGIDFVSALLPADQANVVLAEKGTAVGRDKGLKSTVPKQHTQGNDRIETLPSSSKGNYQTNVIVRTPDNTLDMTITGNEKVSTIKDRIKRQSGISGGQKIRLMRSGTELDDSKKLKYYEVLPDTVLNIE